MSTTPATPVKVPWYKKAFGWFLHFWNSAPTTLQKASSAIKLAAPMLTLVLQDSVGQEYAGEVSNVVAEVQVDMANTATLISQSHISSDKTVSAKIATGLNAITENLNVILDAGHIKNQNLRNDVTAAVQELQAVSSELLPAATATA